MTLGESEKPILFNEQMIRAIRDGKKTQTRRLATGRSVKNPFGEPGGRLWVRETFMITKGNGHRVRYRSDAVEDDSGERKGWWFGDDFVASGGKDTGWRPSLHMPRKHARMFLVVKRVWQERVQEITEAAARAEGFKNKKEFQALWINIYGGSAWSRNPLVWVVEFEPK